LQSFDLDHREIKEIEIYFGAIVNSFQFSPIEGIILKYSRALKLSVLFRIRSFDLDHQEKRKPRSEIYSGVVGNSSQILELDSVSKAMFS
jgi:hypothetical protein